MTSNLGSNTSRRRFLELTGLAGAATLVGSRSIFAFADAVSAPGLVEKARKEAARATITVQRLRGNVSVLMGAGGNIAVLPGRDGKLLIDAGFAGARPKIADALVGISPDPIYSTGGSIDGMIRATEANLAKTTNDTIVIPGHGPVGNKSQLTFYRDLLVNTRGKVATLKKQGRSLDEIVAAKPTVAWDDKWGGGFMSPRMFTGLVFEGV